MFRSGRRIRVQLEAGRAHSHHRLSPLTRDSEERHRPRQEERSQGEGHGRGKSAPYGLPSSTAPSKKVLPPTFPPTIPPCKSHHQGLVSRRGPPSSFLVSSGFPKSARSSVTQQHLPLTGEARCRDVPKKCPAGLACRRTPNRGPTTLRVHGCAYIPTSTAQTAFVTARSACPVRAAFSLTAPNNNVRQSRFDAPAQAKLQYDRNKYTNSFQVARYTDAGANQSPANTTLLETLPSRSR